jgi:hypothetical protein
MAKKPTEFVQFKLRIREGLRREIEKAAKKKAISANAEAVERLEKSFEAAQSWDQFKLLFEEFKTELDSRYVKIKEVQ